MDLKGLTTLLSQGSFSRKLEGYLHGDTAAKKTIYRGVPTELSQRDQYVHDSFSSSADISTLSKYSGYLTAFTYNNRARFVDGVSKGAETVNFVLAAKQQADSSKDK